MPLFEPPADDALPPLTILDSPEVTQSTTSDAALEALSRQVELKLKDFGIEVEVVAVNPVRWSPVSSYSPHRVSK